MSRRVHLGIRVGPRSVGHPSEIRAGQRFIARFGRRRRALTVRVVSGDWALCVPERQTESVRVKVTRLAAVNARGEGAHYRWLGWASRPSGYDTTADVVEAGEEMARLDLPEWGRGRLAETWTRLLPEAARHAGARLRLRANLGSESAARLNMREFTSVE